MPQPGIHHVKISGGPCADACTVELDGARVFVSRIELVADVNDGCLKAVITIPAVTVDVDVAADIPENRSESLLDAYRDEILREAANVAFDWEPQCGRCVTAAELGARLRDMAAGCG